ncbi:hypothetical protein MNV49_007383 [Pseudohyphozyma bogoriensis]|nr:hypothetical protein MNV49_007383 [Pseudohyphozyma bogoriensis]
MKTYTINGAPVGAIYDTGQISDFLLMDDFLLRFAECSTPGDVSTCAFSNVRTGLIVAMLSVGTAFGALLGASLADRLGRRRAITADSGIVIIGSIIQVCSFHSWVQLMIGRIVTGVGIGALSAAIPLYQSETAPKEIRGSLVATYQLFITAGILVSYCISIGTRNMSGSTASGSWRIVLSLNMLWALILGIGILFAPESPRWLFSNGRGPEAEKALAMIRGVRVEDNDFSVRHSWIEIEKSVEEERNLNKYGWLDIFKVQKKTLYRTLLLICLQVLQQFTGANYFFYYGATVFSAVGLEDSFVTQIILGAVNFVCTFGGIYIMEHYGRRVPLIIGGVWQSMWLFVFAAAGTAKNPQPTAENPQGDKGIGNLMIVSACLFIVGYASTWAPAIWILVGETFPTRSRAKQGAMATTGNWLANFFLGFATPFITAKIEYRWGFFFAAMNLTGAVVVYFFLYESSKLSLEAVDQMYNDPNCKPWNSSKWVPEGFESRDDFKQALEAEEKAAAKASANAQHRELADDETDRHSDHTAVSYHGEKAKKENVAKNKSLVLNKPNGTTSTGTSGTATPVASTSALLPADSTTTKGDGNGSATEKGKEKEFVIDGVTFVTDPRGHKLVRKSGSTTPSLTPATASPNSTPKRTTVSGTSYVRTKNGNLVSLEFANKKKEEAEKKRAARLDAMIYLRRSDTTKVNEAVPLLPANRFWKEGVCKVKGCKEMHVLRRRGEEAGVERVVRDVQGVVGKRGRDEGEEDGWKGISSGGRKGKKPRGLGQDSFVPFDGEEEEGSDEDGGEEDSVRDEEEEEEEDGEEEGEDDDDVSSSSEGSDVEAFQDAQEVNEASEDDEEEYIE